MKLDHHGAQSRLYNQFISYAIHEYRLGTPGEFKYLDETNFHISEKMQFGKMNL